MSWFLRAVEDDDGEWHCRFGRQDLGVMPDENQALAFLVATAIELGGRQLFDLYVHHCDGSVECRRALDPLPGEVDGWDAQLEVSQERIEDLLRRCRATSRRALEARQEAAALHARSEQIRLRVREIIRSRGVQPWSVSVG